MPIEFESMQGSAREKKRPEALEKTHALLE